MNERSFLFDRKNERTLVQIQERAMNDSLSKGDQARQEILEAARRLFISQGYNGTSMRDIAKEAGNRAVAGIYNHFPTKQAIFEALIEEYNPYQGLLTALEAAHGETAPEYIHSALTNVMVFMTQHYSFLQLVQIDLREFDGQTVARVLRSQVFPRALTLAAEVKALPGLRPVDALTLVRTFASVVIGFVTTETLGAAGMSDIIGAVPREEWASRVATAVIYGLATPDQKPPSGL